MLKIKTGLFKEFLYQYLNNTEEILNSLRDFLIECAADDSKNKSIRDLSVKIIILIGNLRESGEDLLTAYNLIKDYQMSINVRNELGLIVENQQTSKETDDLEFKKNTEN